MPKVIYKASKGLYQTSGTGFEIQDVVLTPSTSSVTATSTVDPAGAISVDTSGGAVVLTLNDGSGVGQECVVAVADGSNTLGISDGDGQVVAPGAVSTGDVIFLVWNGSNWKQLA